MASAETKASTVGPLVVHAIEDDGWTGTVAVVKGATSITAPGVLAALVDHFEAMGDTPEEAYVSASAANEGRVGWFRWNPCHESSCYDGGGHRNHLGHASGPGRGNWQGMAVHRGDD